MSIALVVGVLMVVLGFVLETRTPSADLGTVTEALPTAASDPTIAYLDPRVPPEYVRIPALRVDAGVDPVTTGENGVLDPPADVSRLGWWSPGSSPLGPGSTVILGHVDSKTQGPGALYDLRETPLGSTIEVSVGNDVVRYGVMSRTAYDKGILPADLFSVSGVRRLVLITCGGPFDSSTGNYEQNIVVTAEPL
ncbi:class F sortase [Rhodococcus sp. APC 3903]|uniref:class F sortase n=1 Tax=Rhodococcus sp. APC 3903 TaxID=3035193 RepID=UPI0025B548D3|nr:class F sortase [Rhodococcus sp. APC 3903]MDN3460683.1 class F sortase [Rhodococcus sp. APC 3903]